MELELHYDDIVILRQIAMRRIEQLCKSSDFSKSSQIHSNTTAMVPVITQPIQASSDTCNNKTMEDGTKPVTTNSGILAWFFPSWSSGSTPQQIATPEVWESPSSSITSLSQDSSSTTLMDKSRSETDFDEAILGEMRAFGRDALLARFNFTLNQGSVLLNKQKGAFLGKRRRELL